MSYIVNFTDKDNKSPITVYDNTSSIETATLTIPQGTTPGEYYIIFASDNDGELAEVNELIVLHSFILPVNSLKAVGLCH